MTPAALAALRRIHQRITPNERNTVPLTVLSPPEPLTPDELRDALYALAMSDSNELELAARSLAAYDINRLALFFAQIDDNNAA